MDRSTRTNEIIGCVIGMVIAAAVLVIAVVISGNYEDLGDRSVPFIYAPAAATIGVGAALAYVEDALVPDVAISALRGLRRLALGFYRS
jgi:hypothetical protein